ncbi:Uncharacterized conserved protein [plant metagenome]|uniref:Uncharacterized conserved protein n=2 Tax=root TaxID=1 RepID=A0A1C3K1X3_9BURK|nr:DUF883 family protein [Orrella dioscoreae]SBT25415.1 Uncharacterized conserved protein [Orrella dioscoreae]SOE48916.1 Uncharacterized conserved protein [Orrella dioscoreae]
MFSLHRNKPVRHRDNMERSFRDLLSSTEDLLRSTAAHTSEEVDGARARLKRQLAHARERAHDWEEVALARTGQAARAADDYVHANVWKSVGAVAVVGIVIGCLAASACLGKRY